ncbi:hypothetical protein SCNU_19852, partial [Gordonia neofelifaecis NRRL B-59395]
MPSTTGYGEPSIGEAVFCAVMVQAWWVKPTCPGWR